MMLYEEISVDLRQRLTDIDYYLKEENVYDVKKKKKERQAFEKLLLEK